MFPENSGQLIASLGSTEISTPLHFTIIPFRSAKCTKYTRDLGIFTLLRLYDEV